MKGTKVAPRYAKALLELAIEQNQVEEIRVNMESLCATIDVSRDFQLLVHSPIIRWDTKIAVFRAVFSKWGDISMKFIELIIKKRREYLLPEIARSYLRQVNQHLGITPVSIVSASPLNDDTRKMIIDKIQKHLSGTIQITETVDTDLLGGFIVQMEGKQMDASIMNQLNLLKQQLAH